MALGKNHLYKGLSVEVNRMYGHEALTSLTATDSNLQDTILIETNVSQTKHNDMALQNLLLLWEPVGLLVIVLVFYSTLYKIGNAMQKAFFINIQRSPQAPCNKCSFYSSNPYLKCAAQPTLVLTENALTCPDYQFDSEQGE